jgi:hypothetical protein
MKKAILFIMFVIILLSLGQTALTDEPEAVNLTPRVWLPLVQSSIITPAPQLPTVPVIVNGDFERGYVGWNQSGQENIWCNGPWPSSESGRMSIQSGPFRGLCFAWQCGYDNCYDQLWTDSFVWPGHPEMLVSVAWYIESTEVGAFAYDYGWLDLIDLETRLTIARLFVHSNTGPKNQWQVSRFRILNMGQFEGRPLALWFTAAGDETLITSFFYDQIEAYATGPDMQYEDAQVVGASW